MNDLYRDATNEDTASAFVFDNKALQRALKHIYEKDFQPMTEIEESLFNETFRIFTEATDEGISESGAELPVEFRQKIDWGNAVFSAFKVHRMQNDIATRLFDSNGVLKPFEQWRNDVHPMLDHHVKHWLRTEYDTAVIRSHQAADWQRFEQYADILPNLEWMPSTSINPGADHKGFWGTILPINHPFWNVHRPGDRWNCKCSLAATDEPSTETPHVDNDPKDQPAPGLDNNPGKDGRLFSDTHPYVTNAYENFFDGQIYLIYKWIFRNLTVGFCKNRNSLRISYAERCRSSSEISPNGILRKISARVVSPIMASTNGRRQSGRETEEKGRTPGTVHCFQAETICQEALNIHRATEPLRSSPECLMPVYTIRVVWYKLPSLQKCDALLGPCTTKPPVSNGK